MLLQEGSISKPDVSLSNEDSSNRKRSSSLTEQVSILFCGNRRITLGTQGIYFGILIFREAEHEGLSEKTELWT